MRTFHRIWAFLSRNFWTACPKCHQHFGGHEAHHHHVKIEGVAYRFVCGRCKPKQLAAT